MAERARPDEPNAIAVFDHLRSIGDGTAAPDRPPGVYRVVGTPEDGVALLRVTDGDGRRAHTGEVHRVARTDLDAFEPAETPDDDRSLAATLASNLDGAAW